METSSVTPYVVPGTGQTTFMLTMSADMERQLQAFVNLSQIVGEVVALYDGMTDEWKSTLTPIQAAHLLCSLQAREVGRNHPVLFMGLYRPLQGAMEEANFSGVQIELMEILRRVARPPEGILF